MKLVLLLLYALRDGQVNKKNVGSTAPAPLVRASIVVEGLFLVTRGALVPRCVNWRMFLDHALPMFSIT